MKVRKLTSEDLEKSYPGYEGNKFKVPESTKYDTFEELSYAILDRSIVYKAHSSRRLTEGGWLGKIM